MSLLDYINKADVICFSSTGNYTIGGKALSDDKNTIELFSKYPEVSKNLALKLKQTSRNIPFLVGALNGDNFVHLDENSFKNKNYSCLIASFPIKTNIRDNINFQLIKQSVIVIEDYMKSFNWKSVVISSPSVNNDSNIIFI